MFSIIVVMAIATSLMAPFALRWVLAKVKIGAEEQKRLEREAPEADSLVADIHRVLVPVRARMDIAEETKTIQSTEAHILDMLGRDSISSMTPMTVIQPQEKKSDSE